MERPVGMSWLWWNFANIVTCFRFFTPIILFLTDWEISTRLIFVFFVLWPTDLYDGRIARHIGNIDGIGKILDPIADKILIGSLFIFSITYSLMQYQLSLAIIIGETIISFAWSIMVYEKIDRSNREISFPRKIYRVILEIGKKLQISTFGKAKMVAYYTCGLNVAINFFWPVAFFYNAYLVTGVAGLVLYVASLIEYLRNYLREGAKEQ